MSDEKILSDKELEQADSLENDILQATDDSFASFAYASSIQINKSYQDMIKSMYSTYKYNSDSIKQLMLDPIGNNKELQDVAEWLFLTNGTFRELLEYKAKILLYEHYIIPRDFTELIGKSETELFKIEIEACKRLEKFNLKYNLPFMMLRLINQGELFIYQVEQDNVVSIQEIPSEICEITKKRDNVFKYGIQLNKINESDLMCYPKAIRNAWKNYQNKSVKNKSTIDSNGFFDLSYDENAFAFSISNNGNSTPYYTHLLSELTDWTELKDTHKKGAILSNFKLIVQKVPTNQDGKLLMKKWDVVAYHESLKSTAPKGVATVTTPLAIDAITFGDANKRSTSYIEDCRKMIYDSAGVNDEIFNGEKSSNEAIATSRTVDTLMPTYLLRQFECWINYNMNLKSETKNWTVVLLDVNRYNSSVVLSSVQSSLTTWASKKMYMALQGLTPLQAINTLMYEDMMGFEKYMKPLSTSFTQSGNEDNGRDSNKEDPTNDKQTSEGDNN